MPSEDPLPRAIDFLSQCERCHSLGGDLWYIGGEYLCFNCYRAYKPSDKLQNYQKVEITITNVHKSVGKRWTRWAGANNDLYTITPEWYCQACKDKQTDKLPSYLIRIQEQEYARICSVCLHTALEHHITNIFDLIEKVQS